MTMLVHEPAAKYLAQVGYKQPMMGAIPKKWQERTVGELIEFQGGSQPEKTVFSATPRPGFVRLIQIRDYKSDKFKVYAPAALLRRFCDQMDIMIGRYGPPVFQILRGLTGAYNVALIKAIPCPEIDREFAFFFLKQDSLFEFIDNLSRRSSGQTGVDLYELRRYPLPLPPLAEQRAIATALSDADALIAGLERLIAKKRDIKQAAMQQLLTGQTRLPGFSGEWASRRLGDSVQFLKNGVHSRAELAETGDVKYLHYGDIHGAVSVFLDADHTAMPYLSLLKAAKLDRLQDGDLVFADASEDKDGIGKAVELRGIREKEVVAGLHTIAARFDNEVLVDGFKAYLPFMPLFSQHLKRLAAGTKVYATNRKHIASVELRLPGAAEQIAIATVLSEMDAGLSALEARLIKTRAIKQGMMQELLTGRTRLV